VQHALGDDDVIRKPIKLNRVASIIALLGALATGHSAFADTLSIGQSGTFTGATFAGYLPAYSFLTITIPLVPSSQLYSSISNNGDLYFNYSGSVPYSYFIFAEVAYNPQEFGGSYSNYVFDNLGNVLPENSALILGVTLANLTGPNPVLVYTEFNDTPEVAFFQEAGGGSGYYFVSAATPLPAALPLFATGLGGLGLLGWHRKRKAQSAA
jgi:hypothetical protein